MLFSREATRTPHVRQPTRDPIVPDERFDLIVIGAGPAGLAGALAAGIFGRKVALIERQPQLGGALINTGTLPSKTLRETALALSGFRSRELYGVDLSLRRAARVADFLHHERDVKLGAQANVEARLTRLPVERINGTARFVSPRVIEVTPARHANASNGSRRSSASAAADASAKPRRLRARFILIATGSTPNHPPEFAFEHPRIWDSDEILNLE